MWAELFSGYLCAEAPDGVQWLVCCVLVGRPDGHQNNLRSAAYEALMEIVKNSAKDCYPAVQKTTLVIMERLQQVLQMEVKKWHSLLHINVE